MLEIVDRFFLFSFGNHSLTKRSHQISFEYFWKLADWINFGSASHITVLKETIMIGKKLQMERTMKKGAMNFSGEEENFWAEPDTNLSVYSF